MPRTAGLRWLTAAPSRAVPAARGAPHPRTPACLPNPQGRTARPTVNSLIAGAVCPSPGSLDMHRPGREPGAQRHRDGRQGRRRGNHACGVTTHPFVACVCDPHGAVCAHGEEAGNRNRVRAGFAVRASFHCPRECVDLHPAAGMDAVVAGVGDVDHAVRPRGDAGRVAEPRRGGRAVRPASGPPASPPPATVVTWRSAERARMRWFRLSQIRSRPSGAAASALGPEKRAGSDRLRSRAPPQWWSHSASSRPRIWGTAFIEGGRLHAPAGSEGR